MKAQGPIPTSWQAYLLRVVQCFFLALLLIVGIDASAQGAIQKLSLEQIEGLIAHGVPDSTMSAQIQAHGLSFSPTPSMLDELRAKGAGPLTIGRLGAFMEAPHAAEAPGGAPGPATKSARGKITRTQLEQAIRGHSPDEALAGQIRLRGVTFPILSQTLDELGSKKAGPRTLAALREQMRVGKLQIQTIPGAHLLLDKKEIGTAGEGGSTLLNEVMEGDHVLCVSADGYHDSTISFSLAKDEYKKVDLPLDWAGGYISLSVQPQAATITVAGPRPFSGAVSRYQALPGDYTATYSLEGFRTQARTFHVAAGQNYIDRVSLEMDPAVAAALLSDAQAKLANGNSPGAIQALRKLLKITPGDGKAYALLSEASFNTGDPAGFQSAANQALTLGQTISIVIPHVHNFPHMFIHPVTVAISRSGLSFTSTKPVDGCKLPEPMLYGQIADVEVASDPNRPGAPELIIKYFSKPGGKHAFMKVLHTINFAAPGAEILPSSGITAPQPGLSLLGSISSLIRAGR